MSDDSNDNDNDSLSPYFSGTTKRKTSTDGPPDPPPVSSKKPRILNTRKPDNNNNNKKKKPYCMGIAPNPEMVAEGIVMTQRYCAAQADSSWEIRPIRHKTNNTSEDDELRVYSKACTKDKNLIRRDKCEPCCQSCLSYRKDHWKYLKKEILQKNQRKYSDALQTQQEEEGLLSDSGAAALKRIVATADKWLNEAGRDLKAECQAFLENHKNELKACK